MNTYAQGPSGAFVGAAWSALLVGVVSYFVGLWSAEMQLNEKGCYFSMLGYGLFAAVAVQKNVRDLAGESGLTPGPD